MAHPPDAGQRDGQPEAEPLYPPKETPWNSPVVRCVLGHLSSRARGDAQLVLVRLATHARKGGNGAGITVGRRTLARETGLGGQTVDDALKWLRGAGLIERDGRGAHGTWKHKIILCDHCQRPNSEATGGESSGLEKGSSGLTVRPELR